MPINFDRAVCRALAIILAWCLAAGYAHAEPTQDVRILIDISGSMKHNDPQNLRAPALRLLTRLLPKGARAGVWTYGQYVNMLVPYGEVTANWKDRAESAAGEINSFGLFTNLEDVMQRATRDWGAGNGNHQPSLIILTDGFVDISKDPALNAAARERIINKILPRLRNAKAKIYAVALSGEADHNLLRQLASATDGWYEQADNADRLQRIFLHLFEKSAHPDTLPLQGNTVKVDNSIEEITFLIFRGPDGKATQLVPPNRVQFGMNNAPKQVRWKADTGYDMITITKPQSGVWQVVGSEDVDNRVVIVTNLKARATPLPNNLSVEDAPYYFVQLMEGDAVIRRKDFLNLVKVTLSQRQQGGQQWEWPLQDDGKGADMAPNDGTFSHKFGESMKVGRHELTLMVDGATFQREQRQVINVYSQPADATITADPTSLGRFVLSVIPHAGMIEPDTMEVSAVVSDSHGTSSEINLERKGPAEWRAELEDHNDPSGYKAEFSVTGIHSGGKPINATLGPFQFSAGGTAIIDKLPEQKDQQMPAKESTPEVRAAEDQRFPPGDEPADIPSNEPQEETQEINWYAVIAQTLLINVLLIGGGYFAYKRWRLSTQTGKILLVDEDDKATGDSAAAPGGNT